MRLRSVVCIVVAMGLLSASVATGGIISAVDRTGGASGNRPPIGAYNGGTDPLPMQAGGLTAGNYMFSDREYVFTSVPADLEGAEYIPTFNSDKGASGVNYRVTFDSPAWIFVTIDERFSNKQSRVDAVVANFASAGAFTDSGLDIWLGEPNGPLHHVYSDLVPAGTYDFVRGGVDGNNFYIIGVQEVVPEPCTLALLAMGGLGLAARRRRRK
jgi:hypothetical protein